MNNLDGWAGQEVVDGMAGNAKYDLPNYNSWGALTEKILGKGTGSKRTTQALLAEGKAAKPIMTPEQQAILQSIGDPAATGDVPRGTNDITDTTITGSDIPEQPQSPEQPTMPPAGITHDDAGAAIDNTLDAPAGQTVVPIGIDPAKFNLDLQRNKAAELERRTWARNINLDNIDNAEQLGPVLETLSEQIPEAAHKSFAEVRKQVDDKGHLAVMQEVLKDNSNPRALSDYQLLAGREELLGIVEQVDELAQRISVNRGSDEDKLMFDKLTTQAVMLQQFMQGSIRETARALSSMRIVAQAVNTGSAEEIAKSAAIGNHQMRAQHLVAMKNSGVEAADRIDEMKKMGKVKALVSALVNLRTASLLTGFKTQLVNAFSNTFYGTVSSVMVNPVAVGVGTLRQAIGGKGERAYLAEVGAEMAGFRDGFRDALMMAVETWKDGTFKNDGEYLSSFGGDRKIDEAVGDNPKLGDAISGLIPGAKVTGIPQVANAWQKVNESISFGLLTASDEFFKAIAYRKSLYSQAVRQAYLSGESDISEKVDSLLNNVTKDMHDAAIDYAENMTFTNRDNVSPALTVFGDAMVKMGNMFPPFRLIAPFVRTPMALFDRSIKFSPLAAIQKDFRERVAAGGADGDRALAEMTLGTVFMGYMLSLYSSGEVTGGGPGFGPGKTELQKVVEKTGWQPHSLNVAGTMVSLQRGFEPVSMPIMAVTSFLDQMYWARQEPAAAEIMVGSIFAMAQNFKDNTYMQGLSDILAVIDERKNAEQYLAGIASGYVPALMRDAADISRTAEGDFGTPRVPPSNQFWEMLRQTVENRIPGTTPEMYQRYWDGTLAVPGGGEMLSLYNSASPVRMRNLQGKGSRKVDMANNELYINQVAPTEPSPNVSIEYGSRQVSGISVNLLDDIVNGEEFYDKLLVFVGQARREQLDALVYNNDYQMIEATPGPGSPQAVYLEKALANGLDMGKKRFIVWLSEQSLSSKKYGNTIKLLDRENLQLLVKDIQSGEITGTDKEMAIKAGAKGIVTHPPRKPPRYHPNM